MDRIIYILLVTLGIVSFTFMHDVGLGFLTYTTAILFKLETE